MKLFIGGFAQGKLDCALGREPADTCVVFDHCLPDDVQRRAARQQGRTVVIDGLHLWIKARMEAGGSPETELSDFLSVCPDCVLISDEIGNGIVPVDAFLREYRDRTGRILVWLADRADEVVRVLCGIGQKIK